MIQCPCGAGTIDIVDKEYLRIDGKREQLHYVKCSICRNILYSRQRTIQEVET